MGADVTELTETNTSKHNLNTVLVLLHILQFFKLFCCISLLIMAGVSLWGLVINTEQLSSRSCLLNGLPGACQPLKEVHGVIMFQWKCVVCSKAIQDRYTLPYCFTESQLMLSSREGKQVLIYTLFAAPLRSLSFLFRMNSARQSLMQSLLYYDQRLPPSSSVISSRSIGFASQRPINQHLHIEKDGH